MAAGSFHIGQRFQLGEVACRLARDVGEGRWAIEELSTGRFREETTTRLLELWSRAELRFSDAYPAKVADAERDSVALHRAYEDAYRQSFSPELWQRAQAKLSYVLQLDNAPLTQQTITPLICEVWESTKRSKNGPMWPAPPHFTTVAAWIRRYRDSGRDIRSLIDRHQEKGSSEPKVDPIVEEITSDVIETRFLTLERPTKQEVLEEIRGLVAKQNVGRLASERLKLPSITYLKRKIGEIAPYDRCLARYGKRVADIKFRAAGMGVQAEKPLARASMDHCRLDLMIIDDDSELPLGRPWLTLILDECTRVVLGFYIGFEEPSNVSASRALRSALMPKSELLKVYPAIVNDWDTWGVIGTLVVDNGMEFHGEVVEQGAGRFGINIQYCPRKKPWFKGKVERLFRTLNTGLLSSIPGKTFSNVLERGDYDPSKHAVLRLSTLREVVLTWIVDVYHQTPHRGLSKDTPARVWARDIQGVDRWLPASSLSVDTAFSRTEMRRLTHKGIEHDCLFYNSQDLRVVREENGSEIDVEIRVMDDDLGSIIVVMPGGEQLIRVPALDVDYAVGLTRWQHRVCKRYQRHLQDDQSRLIGLLEAKNRIRELIRADMGLTKRRTRTRQARFVEETWNPSPPALPAPPTSIPTPASIVPALNVTPSLIDQDAEFAAVADDVPVIAGRRIRILEESTHA